MGSFLNVVILRLPAGRSVVRPRSSCPSCGSLIRWFDNLPVLSWILLGRKCRGCRAPISARYPLVEALTGGLFALAAWAFVVRLEPGRGVPAGVFLLPAWLHLLACLPFLAALVALSFIDLDHRILPDRITKPGMIAGPLLSALLAPTLQPTGLLRGHLPPHGAALALSLAGVLAGWGLIRIVAWAGEKVFRREAMGLGDSKLMGMIGGFTGPLMIPLVLVIASFVGSVVGIASLIITRDREIPFGPFLALGAAAVLLFPAEVLGTILSFVESLRIG